MILYFSVQLVEKLGGGGGGAEKWEGLSPPCPPLYLRPCLIQSGEYQYILVLANYKNETWL